MVSLAAALLARPVVTADTFGAVTAGLVTPVRILASKDDMADAAARIARWTDPTWTGQHAVQPVARSLTASGLGTGLGTLDGRTFRVQVSPGVVGIRSLDQARAEQREPAVVLPRTREQLDAEDDRPPTREITEWSARSRARMVRRIGELDLSDWLGDPDGGDLGMVTWSLPRQWLLLAPNGRAFKALIDAMRMRWTRAGLRWVGLWKLELQERGAPHLHALMRTPALVAGVPFETWVRRAWANLCLEHLEERQDVTVAQLRDYKAWDYRHHLERGVHFSPSVRYDDPRRIAIYFSGHSLKSRDGKEYQHQVPEAWQGPGQGPGRFWGYWGLDRAMVEVDVSQVESDRIARVLRHVARARARRSEDARRAHGRDPLVRVQPMITRRAASAAWIDTGGGFELVEQPALETRRKRPVRRRRKLRSLGAGGRGPGGFVLVNDGQALAYDLARLLGDPTRLAGPGHFPVARGDGYCCDRCRAQREPEVVPGDCQDGPFAEFGRDVDSSLDGVHVPTSGQGLSVLQL